MRKSTIISPESWPELVAARAIGKGEVIGCYYGSFFECKPDQKPAQHNNIWGGRDASDYRGFSIMDGLATKEGHKKRMEMNIKFGQSLHHLAECRKPGTMGT